LEAVEIAEKGAERAEYAAAKGSSTRANRRDIIEVIGEGY
jgi:hypothetical protein